MRCRLGRRSVAKGAGLELGQNYPASDTVLKRKQRIITSQSIDGPLLELLERYVCRRRICVKVQAMRILRVLELGSRKLLLSVVDNGAPFCVDSVGVLSHHHGCTAL